ncbi:hypothetical protein D9Q98_002197 [Chlorella vulgaris]|uniref:Uncharacterized protein n=1 Tax=Chlorella vulgaris TaxID=3077 RepID=A0A9D4Z0G2_CHLVU|nr:hypothetical protein D9Q98_002197 [Chlorella vulgaris]
MLAVRLPRQQRSHMASRLRWSVVTHGRKKSKQEYGTGRARMPGLADVMSGESQSSGSGSSSSSNSGRTGTSTLGGGLKESAEGPSLSHYLEFGRMLGESPDQVQQQLAMGDVRVSMDDASRQYIQEWEREEEESYLLFEAALDAMGSPQAAGISASSKKLQRSKNVYSAALSREELRQRAKTMAGKEQSVPMTAAARRLAKMKRGGQGTALAFAAPAGQEAEVASSGYELVVRRPSMPPSAALAAKPVRPSANQGALGGATAKYGAQLPAA